MNYSVTGEQLTSIADAIRSKVDIDQTASYATVGKNLCSSMSGIAYVTAGETYCVSAQAEEEYSGESYIAYQVWLPNGGIWRTEYAEMQPSTVAIGERWYFTVTVPSGISKLKIVGTDTKYQIEAGSTMTEYEPYDIKISFPDGFVGAINSI